jgi:uncharacterized membrane protein (DUF485 family)
LHAETEHPRAVARNARYGLFLFVVYVILYGGFIVLAVFRPSLMAAPLWGLNVAIAYGFGLIVSALVLALIYVGLCGRSEDEGQDA